MSLSDYTGNNGKKLFDKEPKPKDIIKSVKKSLWYSKLFDWFKNVIMMRGFGGV